MSRNDPERSREDVRKDIEELPDCADELTDNELDDVSGGDDGWGSPLPPPPPVDP